MSKLSSPSIEIDVSRWATIVIRALLGRSVSEHVQGKTAICRYAVKDAGTVYGITEGRSQSAETGGNGWIGVWRRTNWCVLPDDVIPHWIVNRFRVACFTQSQWVDMRPADT